MDRSSCRVRASWLVVTLAAGCAVAHDPGTNDPTDASLASPDGARIDPPLPDGSLPDAPSSPVDAALADAPSSSDAWVGGDCTSCALHACVDAINACGDVPSCSAEQFCASNCPDSDCVDACILSYPPTPEGAAALHTVFACACSACPAQCASIAACAR